MRLVVIYYEGDGFTYSCQNTVPVEYESAEALAVDLEEACKKAHHARVISFQLADQQWFHSCFFEDDRYFAPEILTVDEWFDTIGS